MGDHSRSTEIAISRRKLSGKILASNLYFDAVLGSMGNLLFVLVRYGTIKHKYYHQVKKLELTIYLTFAFVALRFIHLLWILISYAS